MTTEDEENEKKFNEIIDKANAKLSESSTRLMDIHHDSIQFLRETIRVLRTFNERYDEIIENIIIAHSIAAKEVADLYGDVLAGELGLIEVTDDSGEEQSS